MGKEPIRPDVVALAIAMQLCLALPGNIYIWSSLTSIPFYYVLALVVNFGVTTVVTIWIMNRVLKKAD